MRRISLYIICILILLPINAQSKATEDYYDSAFNEMLDMTHPELMSLTTALEFMEYRIHDLNKISLETYPLFATLR